MVGSVSGVVGEDGTCSGDGTTPCRVDSPDCDAVGGPCVLPPETEQMDVTVSLAGAIVNQPPAADAGPDRSVECTSTAGASFTLDGRASTDPDQTTLIGGRESIDPTWASVLLACAATAVGLDRFFGFSSAWMRFVTAGMQLQHLREQFDIDWQESIAAWEGRPPSTEQTVGALAVLRKFLREAHRIVRDETDLWIRKFRNSLQQVDVAVQAGRSGRGAATKPPRDGAPPAVDANPLPDAPATA